MPRSIAGMRSGKGISFSHPPSKVNSIDKAGGGVGMIVRSLKDDWIEAGYDHATGNWQIRQIRAGTPSLLAKSPGSLPLGTYFKFELIAEDASITLKVDGETKASTKKCALKRHGMFGFHQSKAGVYYDDVTVIAPGDPLSPAYPQPGHRS